MDEAQSTASHTRWDGGSEVLPYLSMSIKTFLGQVAGARYELMMRTFAWWGTKSDISCIPTGLVEGFHRQVAHDAHGERRPWPFILI